MLQRIQSLYLGIVVLLYVLLFVFPLSSVTITDNIYTIKSTGVSLKIGETITNVKSFYLLIIINAAIVAATVFCISQFKNRRLQIKLCSAIMFLTAGFLVAEYFVVDAFLVEKALVKPDYKIASMFPAVSLILTSLAQRAIKKDEELVRSADRLR